MYYTELCGDDLARWKLQASHLAIRPCRCVVAVVALGFLGVWLFNGKALFQGVAVDAKESLRGFDNVHTATEDLQDRAVPDLHDWNVTMIERTPHGVELEQAHHDSREGHTGNNQNPRFTKQYSPGASQKAGQKHAGKARADNVIEEQMDAGEATECSLTSLLSCSSLYLLLVRTFSGLGIIFAGLWGILTCTQKRFVSALREPDSLELQLLNFRQDDGEKKLNQDAVSFVRTLTQVGMQDIRSQATEVLDAEVDNSGLPLPTRSLLKQFVRYVKQTSWPVLDSVDRTHRLQNTVAAHTIGVRICVSALLITLALATTYVVYAQGQIRKTSLTDIEAMMTSRNSATAEQMSHFQDSVSSLNSTLGEQMSHFQNSLKLDVTSVKSDVKSMGAQMTTVKSDLTSVKSDVTSVGTQMTTVKSDLTSVKSDVTSVGAQMTTAKSDLTSLKSNVTSVGAQMTTVKSDLTSLKSNVTSVGAQMITVKSDLTSVKSDVKSMGDGMVDEKRTLESEILHAKEEMLSVLRQNITSLNMEILEMKKRMREQVSWRQCSRLVGPSSDNVLNGIYFQIDVAVDIIVTKMRVEVIEGGGSLKVFRRPGARGNLVGTQWQMLATATSRKGIQEYDFQFNLPAGNQTLFIGSSDSSVGYSDVHNSAVVDASGVLTVRPGAGTQDRTPLDSHGYLMEGRFPSVGIWFCSLA